MSRIGVFVCHCGENIARTVDCAAVAETLKDHPGVAFTEDYKYMCSDPGQALVRKAIEENNLTGVVVAACSPHMHEKTFRRAADQAGLNQFMCEMANIREHCSWIHEDRDEATAKAIDIGRTIVEKVKHNRPLETIKIPVTKRAMVIGGGIAGIQAALDIADGGHEVILVEKEASIGGHMSQLSETFPTLDCSQCILTPRMVEAYQHPNIKLHTWSEVEKVDGYIGNFEVTVRKKARSVDQDLCNGCGDCFGVCPSKKIPSEFEAGLGNRTAIYVPFPQAVPNQPVIDRENCTLFKGRRKGLKKDACGKCKETCLKGAIDYDTEDEFVTEEVGAIVVATGFKLYDIGREQPEGLKGYGEYGYGEVPDVIDGLQFERLASASGPTAGAILRPSDGKEPKTVVFVHCVGSRDPEKGMAYCCKICCMYNAKHAMLYKHKVHDGRAIVFYMDIRAAGKGYDEFSRRAIEEDDAEYIRGRVSRIFRDGDKVKVWGFDTLSGEQVVIDADMVVLATAIRPQDGVQRAGPEAQRERRRARLHQRGAPQAAPRGDQHRRRLRRRRLPGAARHPRRGRHGERDRRQGARALQRRRAGARAGRRGRERADLHRLHALRAGVPLRRHRAARDLHGGRPGVRPHRLREPGRLPGLRHLPGRVSEQERRAADVHRRAGLQRDQRALRVGVT